MRKLREEIEIKAAPDRVWAIVGDPTTAHRYVPGVASARLHGATRVCVTAEGHELHELITDRSDETRSYRYEHVKTPMPVKRSVGGFTVAALAGGCVVTVEAELEALAPEMEGGLADMMGMGLKQTLVNLRELVERGS